MKKTIHLCDLCAGPIEGRYATLQLPAPAGPAALPPGDTLAQILWGTNHGVPQGPVKDICEPCVRLLLDHAQRHHATVGVTA